ncbi:TPA: UDP kinase [Candidatus Falkowbacteria bacterium]|nr:UDP kinase [Candidatus Falkowbacteria bacterium]
MVKLNRLQRSFRFALKGLKTVFVMEQNFRIQVLAALIVILAGVYFQLKPWEWVVIILLILFVLVLEMLNTVFERLVDMLQPRVHLYVHDIKNIMSSVVLITVISAIIIGLFIFGSRFL